MEIILASQSPYRKELLSRILSEFKTKASLNDEEEDLIKNEASDIHQLTEKLAQMKAEKVLEKSTLFRCTICGLSDTKLNS